MGHTWRSLPIYLDLFIKLSQIFMFEPTLELSIPCKKRMSRKNIVLAVYWWIDWKGCIFRYKRLIYFFHYLYKVPYFFLFWFEFWHIQSLFLLVPDAHMGHIWRSLPIYLDSFIKLYQISMFELTLKLSIPRENRVSRKNMVLLFTGE